MRKRNFAHQTFMLKTAESWPLVRQAVISLPRTRLVQETADSLEAECRSRIFRFVDDLTVELVGTAVVVHSRARSGVYDFGVNRRRLERLRHRLARRGLF